MIFCLEPGDVRDPSARAWTWLCGKGRPRIQTWVLELRAGLPVSPRQHFRASRGPVPPQGGEHHGVLQPERPSGQSGRALGRVRPVPGRTPASCLRLIRRFYGLREAAVGSAIPGILAAANVKRKPPPQPLAREAAQWGCAPRAAPITAGDMGDGGGGRLPRGPLPRGLEGAASPGPPPSPFPDHSPGPGQRDGDGRAGSWGCPEAPVGAPTPLPDPSALC